MSEARKSDIDLSWLRKVGFVSDGPQYTSWSIRSKHNPSIAIQWNDKFDRIEFAGVVLKHIKTRGQLRLLARALGIALREGE